MNLSSILAYASKLSVQKKLYLSDAIIKLSQCFFAKSRTQNPTRH
ncbi:MAG: hypothetical protein P857_256 [Candidatus Xenolissoclinum pacificiensis L6]|uniref:Uncharacterized protein n=1 Tax=Candidatus Xenolissoclinum pacificiensis L6 TaxID=1401685 RepID=W2UZR3_9RICK|nr:MAG: hypothetical protein P857_256 [Candidatus Xenolissoclinum pacificiensis L6]